MKPSRHIRNLLAIGVTIALVTVAYAPGLSGGFLLDDGANFLENKAVSIGDISWDGLTTAANSGDAGPSGRPLAMASFAINHAIAGQFSAYQMKLTNLAIHLCVVVSLLWFWTSVNAVRASLGRAEDDERVPLIAALLWGLHPLNLTPVLYVVQRMTSMSALFVVFTLAAYVGFRQSLSQARVSWGAVALRGVLVGLLSVAAVCSKESALILPGLMFLVEAYFFEFRQPDGRRSRVLRIFFALLAIACALFSVTYLVMKPDAITSGYAIRNFTIYERMMTEARALWFYLRLTFLPAVSEFGIYHDDFGVSRGMLLPVTTLISTVGWVVTLVSLPWLWRSARIVAFALAWFLCAHLLESTFWPLELIHEHRNYVPTMAPIYAMVLAVSRFRLIDSGKRVSTFILIAIAVVLGGATFVRAQQWGEPLLHATMEAEYHPKSDRAQYDAGRFNLNRFVAEKDTKYFDEAKMRFEAAAIARDAYENGALFGLVHLQFAASLPVDENLLDRLRSRLAKNPPAVSNYSFLEQLRTCQEKHACLLTRSQFESLAQALLSNPRIGANAAWVYRVLGRYYFTNEHDIDSARRSFLASAEAAPRVADHWYVLAQFEYLVGSKIDFDSAVSQLRRVDARGRFSADVARMGQEFGR